jgi:outer membrane lipoprotein-sorting protein
VARPRPSRSSRTSLAVAVLGLLAALALDGCASAPVRRQVSPEAEAALARLEERQGGLTDLRTLADIRIRRDDKTQRLSGVLLLRAPASLRFEALTSFGVPVVLVAGDGQSVTLWEVLDNRAFILPASPDSTRRWLGMALGSEDLVAILSGRVRPLKNPLSVDLLPPDLIGPSLKLTSAEGEQRIWLDPLTEQARQVEWTGGKNPARVTFEPTPLGTPPSGLTLATLDGKLEAVLRYREPRMNTGFDPALLSLKVPEHVRIQDFR